MERLPSRRKAERLIYELEDCLSLLERKHGLCDASVMETSNVGFSTRDDCSFEYSELGDLSLDNTQSLMDETNGPLLLAIVEDYILGQRLQLMTSGESEDDEVSPTSSFESETCFSRENSGVLKQISGVDSFFSNNSDHGPSYDEIEIAATAIDQESKSKKRMIEKSRWQALLLSLSNPRSNLTRNSNVTGLNSDSRVPVRLDILSRESNSGTVPINAPTSNLSKRDSNGESTPSVLHKSWDRLKAVNPLKRSLLHNFKNENDAASSKNIHDIKSLFSPSETSKTLNDQGSLVNSLISTQKDILKSSSILNATSTPTEKVTVLVPSTKDESLSVASPKEEIQVKQPDLSKEERSESSNENNSACNENEKDECNENIENAPNLKLNPTEPRQSSSNDFDDTLAVLDNTTQEEAVLESSGMKIVPVEFSDVNESVEVPKSPSLKVEKKERIIVPTPLRSKIRLPFPRLSGQYQAQIDTTIGLFNADHRQMKNGKLIEGPILCSHCRCKLSEQSICAAIASESHESDACEGNDSVKENLLRVERNLEQEILASNERLTSENHVECIDMERSTSTVGFLSNGTEPQLDFVGDQLVCLVCSLDAIDTHPEMKQSQSEDDCLSNRVEATFCGSGRKTETPTIHIEFKDWQGNEVEIVQESPQKKANRLSWKHGLFPDKKAAKAFSPCIISQEEDLEKNNGGTASIEPFTADENREENTKCTEYGTAKDQVEFVTENLKKGSRTNYFGMITKRTLRSMPRKSGYTIDEKKTSHRLPEQPLQKESNNMLVKADATCELSDEEKNACILVSANEKDSNKPTSFEVSTVEETAVNENEEALLLEQAMKEIHTDAKYDADGSKTRSFLRSPVTLYRFLDYNPCRNELIHENSYDIFAEPVGLSVADLFAPKACFAKQVDDVDGQEVEPPKSSESEQVSEIGVAVLLKPPSSHSSLKKVFRRLTKKVAFRENLIETSPRDKCNERVPVDCGAATLKKEEVEVESKLAHKTSKLASGGASSTCQPIPTQAEAQETNTKDGRGLPEDILKKLLRDNSRTKTKTDLANSKGKSNGDSHDTGEIMDCIITKKAKAPPRKASTSSPRAIKKTSRKKSRSPKTKGEKNAKSKAHAERIAHLLSELKKVKMASKSHGGNASDKNDEESPTQHASDATIATLGTKQSQTSSLSRLTTEEQRLARRMINDIQLLAKIEKKRRTTGNKKSSLKNSDMDRTLKLLLAIEASRRSRIPASTKACREVSIPSIKVAEESHTAQTKEINAVNHITSVFGGLSFFTSMTSKKENN